MRASSTVHADAGTRLTALGRLVLACCALAVLAGCAHLEDPPPASGDTLPLDTWVDAELGPYLAEELAHNPRFKGEPVLLVGFSGSTVRSELDQLSSEIRDRLLDTLLQTPGVRVVGPATGGLPGHHRRLETVDCRNHSEIDHFVGIDAQMDGDMLRLSVRALDRDEGSWVGGFGKTWRGRITPAQRRALGRRRADEHLRGLRALPFEASQTDLMAGYLAHNLSCLLSQSDGESMLLHTSPGESAAPVLHQTLSLVENYLARFREVRITERRQDADVVLSGELHPIDGNLHQAWAMVATKNGGEYLPGLGTEAYIRLDAGTAGDSFDGAATISGAAARSTRDAFAIEDIRLRQADDTGICGHGQAQADAWRRAADGALIHGSCQVVELRTAISARVQLLKVDADGSLSRVAANGCANRGPLYQDVPAGTWARLRPGLPGARPGETDEQTLYVIVTGEARAARALARHLEALETDCTDNGHAPVTKPAPHEWLEVLDVLLSRYDGSTDWRALRLGAPTAASHSRWLSSEADWAEVDTGPLLDQGTR